MIKPFLLGLLPYINRLFTAIFLLTILFDKLASLNRNLLWELATCKRKNIKITIISITIITVSNIIIVIATIIIVIIIFLYRTVEERTEWVNVLKTAINNYVKKRSTFTKSVCEKMVYQFCIL